MKPLVFVICILVAGVAGYLLGESGTFARNGADRSTNTTSRSDRRGVDLPAEEYEALRTRSEKFDELQAEIKRLRAENNALKIEAEGPAAVKGSRRDDGSIVGGARWSKNFELMAVGFLDTMLAQYLKEANLTPLQEKRLREEMRLRVTQAMQIGADYTNGDIDGDTAYERAGIVAVDSTGSLASFLDEKQFALLTKFQGRVGAFVNDHLVNGEIATFRAKLKLDSSQEKKIRKLVEQRYQRVYERIKVPIPNVMMKGMRRRQDEDIYRETGDAIKALLTPDQAATFDRLEREQPQQIFAFRANLIPK